MTEMVEGVARVAWYMLTGRRYLWRVWPPKFIIRHRGIQITGVIVFFGWALGYLPRVYWRKSRARVTITHI